MSEAVKYFQFLSGEKFNRYNLNKILNLLFRYRFNVVLCDKKNNSY